MAIIRSVASSIIAVAAMAQLARAQERTVYESEGAIKVVTGEACGRMAGENRTFGSTFEFLIPPVKFSPQVRSGPNISLDPIVMDVPAYADESLVFLNGFKGTYESNDHHIGSLGASVGTLTPDYSVPSGVEIADKGTDDEVTGCFYYTGIAWSYAGMNARVETNIEPVDDREQATVSSIEWSYPPVSGLRIALPLRYLMTTNRGDRHLIQYAYNLTQDRVSPLRQRVRAEAIMKDNDRSSKINFYGDITMMVSITARFLEAPFELEPRNGNCSFWSGCSQFGRSTPYRQLRRLGANENEIIIPVLTGFDLDSSNDDDHIKHVGAWIDDFRFNPELRTFEWYENADFRDKGDSVFNHRLNVAQLRLTYTPVGPLADVRVPGGIEIPTQENEADSPETSDGSAILAPIPGDLDVPGEIQE
ncbi:MAG: hypothetical protein AAFZ91_04675 [Pseudomonadota bacterium]